MVKKNKIVAIVQARLSSKRFPKKIFKKINNVSIIDLINKRLQNCKYLDDIVYAIPLNKENNELYNHLKKRGCKIFRGDENNVLDRFYKSAKKFNADTIVRVTSDCPLIDPKMVDRLVKIFNKSKVDYLTNTKDPNFNKDFFFYPDGLDIEIFSFSSLKKIKNYSLTEFHKQHVSSFLRYSDKFKKLYIKQKKVYKNLKLSVDDEKSLKNIKKIFNFFYPNIYFSYNDIIKKKLFEKFFKKDLILQSKTKNLSKSLKLWRVAEQIIPGGNMLLSKNPNRYLPNNWPTYYKSAKGCTITDLDNNKYYDLTTMGIGTNILGYSNPLVDLAVKKAVNNGNMSTLNCPEEVLLAKKLLQLHPWFHMVKFARTGGEANSIAIRIARAANGNDNVAICGYHGWHDWYLSTNLNKSKKNNLNNHLMKELNIAGVPKKLKNTTFSFEYGDFKGLKKLVSKNNIGIIKMEVCRNTKPNINFLKKVRNLATAKNIILIFDECTTGFRENFGGLHKKINIKPDMAIFGKALGNGYAITAVLGKDRIMQSSKKTFISSTFWTERLGTVAALKTLETMNKIKSWKKVNSISVKIKKKWNNLFNKYNLKVSIKGTNGLLNFVFNCKNHQAYKTLITQEMLKNNILATNAIYPCIKHSDKILNNYFINLEKVLKKIDLCENKGQNIQKFIKSNISERDFYRYN